MNTYTYTEARQKLASLLEQAAKYGEVRAHVCYQAAEAQGLSAGCGWDQEKTKSARNITKY